MDEQTTQQGGQRSVSDSSADERQEMLVNPFGNLSRAVWLLTASWWPAQCSRYLSWSACTSNREEEVGHAARCEAVVWPIIYGFSITSVEAVMLSWDHPALEQEHHLIEQGHLQQPGSPPSQGALERSAHLSRR